MCIHVKLPWRQVNYTTRHHFLRGDGQLRAPSSRTPHLATVTSTLPAANFAGSLFFPANHRRREHAYPRAQRRRPRQISNAFSPLLGRPRRPRRPRHSPPSASVALGPCNRRSRRHDHTRISRTAVGAPPALSRARRRRAAAGCRPSPLRDRVQAGQRKGRDGHQARQERLCRHPPAPDGRRLRRQGQPHGRYARSPALPGRLAPCVR